VVAYINHYVRYARGGPSLTLTNSTVSGNAAAVYGGIINIGGSLTLSRSLVFGEHRADWCKKSVLNSPYSFTDTFNLLGHNGLTTAEAIGGSRLIPATLLPPRTVTSRRPWPDILTTILQNHGGPTLTHNLVAGSPAIDAAGATCDLTTDQRGAPRPVDGNGDGVAACDIGAVEFSSVPSTLDCSTATASVSSHAWAIGTGIR